MAEHLFGRFVVETAPKKGAVLLGRAPGDSEVGATKRRTTAAPGLEKVRPFTKTTHPSSEPRPPLRPPARDRPPDPIAAPMSDSSSSPPDASEGRLDRAVQTLATLARRLSWGVAALTAGSGLAGGTLWTLLWWPVPPGLLSVAGALATAALLLGPAATLGLFYVGLRDLWALPERLSERATRTLEQSGDAVRSVATESEPTFLGRLWGLVKQIWALRQVLLENRALLVRYGALVRFVTPGFLLLVALAAGLSLLLIPVAVLAALVAALW